jgi:hypothetical protein
MRILEHSNSMIRAFVDVPRFKAAVDSPEGQNLTGEFASAFERVIQIEGWLQEYRPRLRFG